MQTFATAVSRAGSRLARAGIGSMLVLLCCNVVGYAQGNEQALINEIIRRAEARASEAGFCADTKWPPGSGLEAYTAYLRAAAVGSWKVNTYDSGNCSYDRVTGVHWENGGKCVTYTYWTCTKGTTCGVGSSVNCLDKNGVFIQRRSN
jgi:hypothetical protein